MNTIWDNATLKSLERCTSFKCLSSKALKILKNMQPGPVIQVCGPISTGGLGSIEKNLEVLDKAVKRQKANGYKIFEQKPLEKHIRRIAEYPQYKERDYLLLLDDLYLPLFVSGMIHELHFVPNWQTSVGTTWEHEQAKKLGLKIEYLKNL